MKKDLFKSVKINPEMLAKIRSNPFPPTDEIAIYFTPRSGSSRVTEILANTNTLGRAGEFFNPNFIPNIAQAVQATNLTDYVENCRRKLSTGGVFSFQVTSHQINAVFPDTAFLFKEFGGSASFWLIREDIVAQAVSLAKMVTTQVAHSANSTEDEIAMADKLYEYDRHSIKRWLMHIRNAEIASEDYFSEFGISPTRTSYERLAKMDAKGVVDFFRGDIPIISTRAAKRSLTHRKISTKKNERYAERFRDEERDFLVEIEKKREPTLINLAKNS